nr:Tn3 family transposase [Synechocystis sp. PCC 7509]
MKKITSCRSITSVMAVTVVLLIIMFRTNTLLYFTHFITCGVWEAVYIFWMGLLKNTSDIQPDILHADTQGQSAPVFALSYLLGIKLMPRIRNWQDLTFFFRPTKEAVYKYTYPL